MVLRQRNGNFILTPTVQVAQEIALTTTSTIVDYLYQELIIRRREYRMVKLSPESNVTIQLRFDALTCCVFANIIQASANQVM